MFKKTSYIIPFLILSLTLLATIMEKPKVQKEISFSPLFQIFGKFVQTADVALSRMLIRGDFDEKKLGAKFKIEFNKKYPESKDSIYLNQILQELNFYNIKDFDYRVFVDENMAPNAYAMPGGIIVFSSSLLNLLENEAQIVAILCHEIAHIELDHCINAFKFKIVKENLDLQIPGIYSRLYEILIGLSFSKTQEDEADEYSFDFLLNNTDYWPYALSESFQLFLDELGKTPKSNILSEFFQSHPHMEYRIDKYANKARSLTYYGDKYLGRLNWEKRETKGFFAYTNEWKEP